MYQHIKIKDIIIKIIGRHTFNDRHLTVTLGRGNNNAEANQPTPSPTEKLKKN